MLELLITVRVVIIITVKEFSGKNNLRKKDVINHETFTSFYFDGTFDGNGASSRISSSFVYLVLYDDLILHTNSTGLICSRQRPESYCIF